MHFKERHVGFIGRADQIERREPFRKAHGEKLGRAVGVFAFPEEFGRVKSVFWTDNPIGNALHENLLTLVAAGVLERREEPDEQFRWRSDRERPT